jgi:hypothetical protein
MTRFAGALTTPGLVLGQKGNFEEHRLRVWLEVAGVRTSQAQSFR